MIIDYDVLVVVPGGYMEEALEVEGVIYQIVRRRYFKKTDQTFLKLVLGE